MDYKHNILIVDDEEPVCKAIKSMLELNDEYKVSYETDSAKALTLMNDNAPDMVILDVVMPGMTGIEVLKELKRSDHTSDITVIIFTGYTNEKNFYRAASIASKADMFMLKELDKDVFLPIVEHLLANRAN